MDLSGSMQGAGGVGGLLSVNDGSATYYPTFDGNGNVSEYVDATGVVVAHYEYDAFGQVVGSGAMKDDFTHQFSTKQLDSESGLHYYGYRYYDSSNGRWPSRDPIEERGGLNVFGFVNNEPIDSIDVLGLVIEADKIKEGDSCSENCKTCRFRGQLKIKDNSTNGVAVKAKAYGRISKSVYIRGQENCGDECCARTWYWWDCYGKKCRSSQGEEFNETITPIPPKNEGPSEGGVRALALSVHQQKVCRCEKGTWKCNTAQAATNRILYNVVDEKDPSKGWKIHHQ